METALVAQALSDSRRGGWTRKNWVVCSHVVQHPYTGHVTSCHHRSVVHSRAGCETAPSGNHQMMQRHNLASQRYLLLLYRIQTIMNPAAREAAIGPPPIRSVVAPDINPIGGGIVDDSQAGEFRLCRLLLGPGRAGPDATKQQTAHATQPIPPPEMARPTAPNSQARRSSRRASTPRRTIWSTPIPHTRTIQP